MIMFYHSLRSRGKNSTEVHNPMPRCILFIQELEQYHTSTSHRNYMSTWCSLILQSRCSMLFLYITSYHTLYLSTCLWNRNLHIVHHLRTGVLSTCSHACTIECISTHGINVFSQLMISIRLTIHYLGVFNHVFVIEC